MQPKQPIEIAADCVGGQKRLAEILGVSTQAIGHWKQRGVPVEHCAQIEKAANSKVTRRELRPDDWKTIWPELERRKQPSTDKAGA